MSAQEEVRRRHPGVALLLWLSVSAVSSAGALVNPDDATGRSVIAEFDIRGAESVNERELRAALQTRASPWLPWDGRVHLDPAALDNDVRRTREFYAARGFPNATVTSEVEAIGSGTVRVWLIVEEGEPLRFEGFRFEGFDREAWTVRMPDLRYSAGAGVLYHSPFGPLRLDLGYQLTPIDGLRMEGEPRTRRWRLHLTFGHSF